MSNFSMFAGQGRLIINTEPVPPEPEPVIRSWLDILNMGLWKDIYNLGLWKDVLEEAK